MKSVKTEGEEYVLATVKVPIRSGWANDHSQFVAKFHRFRKWWKFWEDKYEEVPLEIVDLVSQTDV
ncbi:hypothetical protein KAU11_09080 [Candidatus Babeliales bacterium]|nr:hypothetical protein [Candidatus Babeliales bacterium]